jgi:hypothetical protein
MSVRRQIIGVVLLGCGFIAIYAACWQNIQLCSHFSKSICQLELVSLNLSDPDADCFGWFTVDCPTAAECSDTVCEVPSVAAINGSSAYSLDDIGLPVGNNTVGVLQLRSQDVLCPGSASWDDEHSLPSFSCRKVRENETSAIPDRPYKGVEGPESAHYTTLCYNRKKCNLTCEAGEPFLGPFTMTKTVNGETQTRQYMLPTYRCNSEGSIGKGTVSSLPYYDCDTSTPCHPPVQSGPD